jgi:hypothetical protein
MWKARPLVRSEPWGTSQRQSSSGKTHRTTCSRTLPSRATVEMSLMKVSPPSRVIGATTLSSRARRELFASVEKARARQLLK